jgi:16S rRNA (cytosine967-C5)-methyltransferase
MRNPATGSGERRAGARDPQAAGDRTGIAVRGVALEILIRVESQSAFADVLLGNRIGDFAPPDRRLLTRLVLGTLAWRGRLDYEIGALAARRLDQIDPAVLAILRLGLYQLRFLDRIPKHAAVDTSVTLAKEDRATRAAAGLINAILRKAAVGAIAMPDPAGDAMGYLAIACSHPRWLVEKFVGWFGASEAERLMAANNEAAPNAIRLNLARGERGALIEELRRDGFEIASDGRLAETVILNGAAKLDSASYSRGLIHAQSEASQLVARMLAPAPGALVIDCAAAPGGKATHMAEIVGPRGRVVAIDMNLAGLRKARGIAARLGHVNLVFVRADTAVAPPVKPARFVLLDAPCTGLGTLREHPEIRWRLKSDDLKRLGALQSTMLEPASAVVRPGGVLVYAVCSLAPQEGREVITRFLARHAEFTLDRNPPIKTLIPEAFDADGTMLTRPDRDGLDGFFAARLARR